MTSLRVLIVLFMALLLASVGCNTSEPPPPAGSRCDDPSIPYHGVLYAVIDGVDYTGQIVAADISNNTLNIASEDCEKTVSVNFGTTAAVGTTKETQGASGQVETMNGSTVTGVWKADDSQGIATITLATLTAYTATGTISFSAPAFGSGATGTKVVTSGNFYALF